jgi:NAD(P)H-flavin reductase
MPAIEIEHGCARGFAGQDALAPIPCRIAQVSTETSDVKAFRVQTLDGAKPFESKPGQTAMLSVIPFGECMFCISAQGADYLEFTVKRVGYVTEQLHSLGEGDIVGLRGPYGNWFPYQGLRGKDLLFVGGGIGMAPLRSLITYILDNRQDYGRIELVYSGSSPDDLVFYKEISEVWPTLPDFGVHLSVYRESPGWDGAVSYTAPLLESLGYQPDSYLVVLCGGPSLFKTCLASLGQMGFDAGSIITTLEMKMKCGIGKCGRCNVGSHYICLDGPVFTMAELDEMGAEVH